MSNAINLAVDVYSQIPLIKCVGKCQASCGPIDAFSFERRIFERATSRSFPDALKVLRSGDLTCPLLDLVGRCSVYANRPLICRLWGVVKTMQCPHGCTPEYWLSDKRAHELLNLTEGAWPTK
jgi:Fe-S-cluster containining protein